MGVGLVLAREVQTPETAGFRVLPVVVDRTHQAVRGTFTGAGHSRHPRGKMGFPRGLPWLVTSHGMERKPAGWTEETTIEGIGLANVTQVGGFRAMLTRTFRTMATITIAPEN